MIGGKGAGRIYKADSLPSVLPTGFSANDYLYLLLDKKTYQFVSGNWVITDLQLSNKGDKGDKGDTGIQGNTGQQGIQGIQGLQGIPGTNGTGSGASYESTRFVSSTAEYKAAIASFNATGNPRVINCAKAFTLTEPIDLKLTRTGRLILDGCFQDITVDNAANCAFIRTPASTGEANAIIDQSFEIRNFHFIDNNINKGPNYTGLGNCIQIAGLYSGDIHHNWFRGFDTSIKADFWLGNNIYKNRFWAAKTCNISIGWNGIPGGTPSETQSNVSRIQNNVIRVEPGAFSAISVFGSSGVIIDQNVIEGGNSNHIGSFYGVYFDDNGSPNVKSVTISNNHFEVIFTKARNYIKLQAGNAYLIHNYFQYPGVDLETSSGGYAIFHLDTPDYLPSPTTYTNGGGTFEFLNYEWNFDPFAVATWGTSGVPNSVYLERFGNGADKIKYIQTKPAMIINGKYY